MEEREVKLWEEERDGEGGDDGFREGGLPWGGGVELASAGKGVAMGVWFRQRRGKLKGRGAFKELFAFSLLIVLLDDSATSQLKAKSDSGGKDGDLKETIWLQGSSLVEIDHDERPEDGTLAPSLSQKAELCTNQIDEQVSHAVANSLESDKVDICCAYDMTKDGERIVAALKLWNDQLWAVALTDPCSRDFTSKW
uniref:Uncharacterized protein n=1 Tax=Chenopodium quinoa TaxID=63459 RepID=A0A803N3W9_CHEQI